PAEPPAVRPEIKLPPSVSMKRVQDILKEVEVPPLKATQDEMALRASSMPLFDPKVMDQYLADEAATPFREAVRKAQAALNTGVKGKRLREEFRVPGDQNKFKEELKDYQTKELATVQSDLLDVLDELRAAGRPEERAKETSKRWLANYDYLQARLQL